MVGGDVRLACVSVPCISLEARLVDDRFAFEVVVANGVCLDASHVQKKPLTKDTKRKFNCDTFLKPRTLGFGATLDRRLVVGAAIDVTQHLELCKTSLRQTLQRVPKLHVSAEAHDFQRCCCPLAQKGCVTTLDA